MKKAFTLVEMLVVVVVLVTLMTITFRLSSIGEDQTKRNQTISRMQRLENCLSGYYAAFGTYPPVRLHGSRNIYAKISGANNMQSVDDEENKNIWGWNALGEEGEYAAWNQVKAACLAQPVACQFPFTEDYDSFIETISEQVKTKANSSDSQYKEFWSDSSRKARFSRGFSGVTKYLTGLEDSADWRETQVFQFGVMAFLLPRYAFMLSFPQDTWNVLADMKQWTVNNMPQHDPYTGNKLTWETIRQMTYDDNGGDVTKSAKLLNIPSQAACARWMSNLEGICSANGETTFFGITISVSGSSALAYEAETASSIDRKIYSSKSGGSLYVLDEITVLDGWKQEFYYYSPKPYQTYTLWSAGPNGRTFPPWIDRAKLDNASQANKCISLWIQDDIIHMKN